MFHSPVYPASALVERLRVAVAPRAVGIIAALLIELALLLLLLSLGITNSQPAHPTVVSLNAQNVDDPPPPPPAQPKPTPTSTPNAQPRAAPAPTARPPTAPVIRPQATVAPPLPFIQLPSDQLALSRISPHQAPAATSGGAAYGPPSSGGGDPDSQRVGTAPNGQPMYAARWFHEPYDDQLRGYLSTASGPGWALIACKTVPEWRVEDCVGLDEYPEGSRIQQAVLAAAWQFRVRPPRKGGEYRVGEWVRIRIDYDLKRG